jgi:hypothetical protein
MISKLLLTNASTLLGKYITLVHYFDANLYHDMLTGHHVTGLLHLLNKTPIDWYSKKQSTVETATYGSESIASGTCVDQVIDLCTSLCYLGVPIHDTRSFVIGDNKSMTDSAAIPHPKLHKHHNALSLHHVHDICPPNAFLCIIFLANSTQPISLPNTGAIHKSGIFFSHLCPTLSG